MRPSGMAPLAALHDRTPKSPNVVVVNHCVALRHLFLRLLLRPWRGPFSVVILKVVHLVNNVYVALVRGLRRPVTSLGGVHVAHSLFEQRYSNAVLVHGVYIFVQRERNVMTCGAQPSPQ